MDFKYYRKNVRRGPMSQKSYERWVMNDGVDPEDGVGGNRIGGGAAAKQTGEWGWAACRYASRLVLCSHKTNTLRSSDF